MNCDLPLSFLGLSFSAIALTLLIKDSVNKVDNPRISLVINLLMIISVAISFIVNID